jgi:hypothetical protein
MHCIFRDTRYECPNLISDILGKSRVTFDEAFLLRDHPLVKRTKYNLRIRLHGTGSPVSLVAATSTMSNPWLDILSQ